jgi:hypothetical protein
LAALVFVALILGGVGEPFGILGVVLLGIVLVVTSGLLSVTLGERYLDRLLRLIKWLA